MNRFNPRSVAQQMERYNLSHEEAETKVAEIIATKAASNPYSIEGQMKRFNITREEAEAKVAELKKKTATGHLISDPQWQMNKFGLTQEEAELKIKKAYELRGKSVSRTKKETPASHFNTVEYWQSKGFSLEEAEYKKAEHIKKMQSVFQEAIRNDPNQYVGRTPLELEYWTNRGYSEEEAKILRKERQRTFTLEKCISKYGEDVGTKKWKDRQTAWTISLHNNFKLEGDGRSPQSIWAKELIRVICNYFNLDIPAKEKWISSKTSNLRCSYDFTYNNKIIEFNGDFWHANPIYFKSTELLPVQNILANEKWELDKQKIKLAESYGYEVLVIWESEYQQSPELIIDKCIKYLTN
jgi:hypothetical protein